MRDFGDKFKIDRNKHLINTTTRNFTKGLPSTGRSRATREIRRAMAWELFLQGNDVTSIALKMEMSPTTISHYIEDSREMIKPQIIQDNVNHVIQFIAEQDYIRKRAFARIEKQEAIEDMWVERTFGEKQAPEEEQDWWDTPPDEQNVKKKRPRNSIPEIPISLKQEAIAGLLSEASKASMNIAKVKGLITNKINVEVSIDMMSDSALLEAMQKIGVDPASLNIGNSIVEQISQNSEEFVEGSYKEEFVPNETIMEAEWDKDYE